MNKKMFACLVMLISVLLLPAQVVLGAGGDIFYLAPQLSIENNMAKKLFFMPERLDNDNSLAINPEFTFHIRPLVLICDLAKAINEAEPGGVKIYMRAFSKESDKSIDFKPPLDKITKYQKILIPFFKAFCREYDNGGEREVWTKEAHYFKLTFTRPDGSPFIPPARIPDLFRDFFANKIARKDGTLIDVSFFSLQTKKLEALPETDLKEIFARLGYSHLARELLPKLGYGSFSPSEQTISQSSGSKVFTPDVINEVDPRPIEFDQSLFYRQVFFPPPPAKAKPEANLTGKIEQSI